MATNIVNITPAVKRDLYDYFPQTYANYPGYIKQERFRMKLKGVFEEASKRSQCAIDSVLNRPTEMRDAYRNTPINTALPSSKPNTDNRPSIRATPADPTWSTNLKTEVLKEVDRTKWAYMPPRSKFEEDLNRLANDYFKAAAFGVASNKISTLTSIKKNKLAGEYLSKQIANGNINKKLGQFTGKHIVGSHKIKVETTKGDIEKKLEKWTNEHILRNKKVNLDVESAEAEKRFLTLVDANISDFAIGKTVDFAGKNQFSGIEVSLNNENTRRWLSNLTGMSNAWAEKVMKGVDFAIDFFPIAATTKFAESTVTNTVMGFYCKIQAHSVEQSYRNMESVSDKFNEKLKQSIRHDLMSLTDTDIMQLAKLIEIK